MMQHRRAASPAVRRRRLIAAIVAAIAVLVVAALVIVSIVAAAETPERDAERTPGSSAPPSPAASATPTPSPTPSAPTPPVDRFDRSLHSIDDANSIWVVANKLRPLAPIDYAPADAVAANVPGSATMRAEAAAAMEAMFAAAGAEAGLSLTVQNAYRSYATQVSLHERLVGQLGRERARAQSAAPGHSEHQTGLSADIMAANGVCSIQECFATTPEGSWLAEHAWRFGYHLRYPLGKTDVTGYIFEPWHYRYVGIELAAELRGTGVVTLEEFFGLPPAPDYPPGF